MPPRRGRSRRSTEGSRAPDSDEDVHRVDDVTRRIVSSSSDLEGSNSRIRATQVPLVPSGSVLAAVHAVVMADDFVDSAEGDMRLRSVVELEDFAIFVVSRDISLGRVLR
ncbi:hypothetical protein F511_43418 [Dorcoceras hygrometricum]|uniref:Uncharacterized protein n=1 Tax=Dorcoceras hygrometricum TaxID=472368 RepID=A0A2Z7DFF3_9LAMI|nr:hypothetical protein F511_43418 [Dorcoceras hygrometricum]